MSEQFLAYFATPFDADQSMFTVSDSFGQVRELKLEDVCTIQTLLVSYQLPAFVDLVRVSGGTLPNCLVDIGDALKIQSGTSRDDGGESQWDIWTALEPHISEVADFQAIISGVETRTALPDRQEMYRLLAACARALRDLWLSTCDVLSIHGEYERFSGIEIPIQQIFLFRQLKGIAVNRDVLSSTLNRVRNEKYSAFREIAETLSCSPTGLSFRTIGPHLAKTDARHLAEFSEQANFEEYFKIARHTSSFAACFYTFIRASDDLSILTAFGAYEGMIYPEFKCFGTVTGRVLVANPRLQELRRRHRGIIAAMPGMTLVYLDYSQFEPGILAYLTNDENLRAAYETSDLYSSLSVVVFGRDGERDTCKQVFLAYCFGMSIENIVKLLAGAQFSLERLIKYRDTIKTFFQAFPGLESYRERMQRQLEAEGFVSSALGNRRVRRERGPLTGKERRWALNHVVQGTASLIFKNALIGLEKRFGKGAILFPMHDAVLLQFDPAAAEKEKHEAIAIMESAFASVCPGITARVVSASFGN
jgi:DNA polymerase-1